MNKAEGLERQAAAANFWQRALISSPSERISTVPGGPQGCEWGVRGGNQRQARPASACMCYGDECRGETGRVVRIPRY